MTELTLPGCRTTPLGGYLSALGLLRVVTRVLDSEATGRWDRQRFVLGSQYEALEELVDALLARFEPEAIVSPWNEGAGFVAKSSNRTAARAVATIRNSTDPRLVRLREAVLAGDRIVQHGLSQGWGGTGNDVWDKKRKPELLVLCRNELPDHALPWLDAAVALEQDGNLAFSRLLGTGGNFGRQDLSATYLARLHSVLTDHRSPAWLHSALSGEETTPYLRDTLGQFDPGRAGGIQSSPLEKADEDGFVNPWAFLLTVEGTLLFAGAVVRRHGAGYARVALPFQVHGSTVGYPTQAQAEKVLGELWAPEWSALARLDEIAHLLAEGRAEWDDRPASSGLDFARAVSTLGVDRGIDAFERHLFVDRHGQNPLAVPAGRIRVRHRPGVRVLARLDPWLDRLQRADLPSQVQVRLRELEQALFSHARAGEPQQLAEVIAALGRCHEAVTRSGAARRAVPPLLIPGGPALFDELRGAAADDAALQVALALATARDPTPQLSLRTLLSPVTVERDAQGHRVSWADRQAPAPLSGGLFAALTETTRWRGFPGAVAEVHTDLETAVKGVRIAFQRGVQLSAETARAFIAGELDDNRLAALIAGLLTADWTGTPGAVLGTVHAQQSDPALDLLLPFTGTDPLRLPEKVLLRPGSEWPALLGAGRCAEVLDAAARRLRVTGLRHVITPAGTPHDGARLAPVLLLSVPHADRLDALRRIAVLPQPTSKQNQEISA